MATIVGLAGNDYLEGTGANDSVAGLAGNDTLIGFGGTDTLAGGAGNDYYVLFDNTDTVVEIAGEGIDTVEWTGTAAYTIAANVEHLILAGSVNVNGFGNTLNNSIVGNYGANSLFGNVGNDTLIGGGGADTLNGGDGVDSMAGGQGADTYYVNVSNDITNDTGNASVIIDGATVAIRDKVFSSANYTIGTGIENLELTGTAANGTGNALNNSILGNSSNNVLNGLAGSDTMDGAGGSDTFYVDSVGDRTSDSGTTGVDQVFSSASHAIGTGIENLTLTGTGTINGTGNGDNNSIIGNTGNNILNGGAGTDTMSGSTGNDSYYVDDTNDVINETGTNTGDKVFSSANYTIGTGIENLELIGTTAINGTGNASKNTIIGNSAANVLDALGGSDVMDGKGGGDTYIVDNLNDKTNDTGAATSGVDRVESSVNYTIGTGIEVLELTGTAANGTGNTLNNSIIGNASVNILNGSTGADTMVGAGGNDTYYVDNAGDRAIGSTATDTVVSTVSYSLNFSGNSDLEILTLGGTTAINGTGDASINTINGNSANNILDGLGGADVMDGKGGGDTYYVDSASDTTNDTGTTVGDKVISSVSYTLGTSGASNVGVEILQLVEGSGATNGIGNGLNNSIVGNSAANSLNGGTGADTMVGAGGNDSYVVDNVGDRVNDSAGTDTVFSSVSYNLGFAGNNGIDNLTLTAASSGTGNALNNSITGSTGADTLYGALGADTLTGGTGADVFVIDNAAGTSDTFADFTGTEGDKIDVTILPGASTAVFVLGSAPSAASPTLYYDTPTLFYDQDGTGGIAPVTLATVNGSGLDNINDFILPV
jgi:Ca2+-binding RTX toxin-like protein